MRQEQNDLITRIGPGTPCGKLMRHYWQPVALLDEFDPALDPSMGLRPVKGVVKKTVNAGSEPKSLVNVQFTGEAPYSEDEQLRIRALVDVMNIRIIDVLREKLTLIYGGGMGGGLSRTPYSISNS